jgi:hypothetical protein
MTSMTLPRPVPVVGSQSPRICSFPPFVSTAGDEAVQLAARAGLMLDPWQQLVLRNALGEQSNGLWSAFEVGLVVPRQNGKGSVLEALELAALFLADPGAPPPLILHSAHEFKTSAEHFRRMRTLVENAPLFNRQVRIIRTAAGAEAIELHSGARLRFVTRSGGSGRGFSADLIVIDEAYNLTAESMAAVLPTLSARPNPQIWYTSSAGMESSDQLARVRERGLTGSDPSLAYFEWSAADGVSLDDRESWAEANPALGLRIPERFVVSERAALPDEQFGRERLGLWADRNTTTAVDPLMWAALADPEAERSVLPVFGVAVAPDRSWSAVAAAWRREDGKLQVALTEAGYRPDATWVSDQVASLRLRAPGCRVWVDTAARGLSEDVAEPSQGEQAQADNALVDAILAGSVRHGADPAVDVAVRSARWKPTGDTRILDRRKGDRDISPLRAVSLAAWGVVQSEASDMLGNVW